MIEKVLGGHGQKWVWPVWSRDSKINCISRMKRWNELIFRMLEQIQESGYGLVDMVKNGYDHLVHEI